MVGSVVLFGAGVLTTVFCCSLVGAAFATTNARRPASMVACGADSDDTHVDARQVNSNYSRSPDFWLL